MTKDKVAPGNTAAEMKKYPMGFVLEAIVLGQGPAIKGQEARGQQDLVNSTTLPTEMGSYDGYTTKTVMEQAGVKFLGPVEGDELFQYVELPPGWKKVATDHSMWTKLVDDKGRERAAIFYKAAFYDRKAYMGLTSRYGINRDYEREKNENVAVAHVTDRDQVIHTTEPLSLPADRDERYKISDKALKAAGEWLKKNFPDWENPGAYWD
jgi:hypothetical protein